MSQTNAIEKNWSQAILGAIGDGVVSLDARGVVDYLNPSAERITGWTRDAAIGTHVVDVLPLIGLREPPAHPDATALSAWFHSAADASTILRARDGSEREIQLSVSVLMDVHGEPQGLVLTFRDISQTATLMRELAHRASHDSLTGLHNREEFERRLKRMLGDAQSGGGPHALCYVDLDRFKLVNETCGHAAGDALLKEVSAMLRSLAGEDDLIARLGDDAFGLLLPQMSANRAMQIAQKAVGTLEHMRFVWGDRQFAIGGSAGVTAISPDVSGVEEVLIAAGAACHVAKEQGRNRVHLFEPADVDVTRRQGEMRWVPRLQAALEIGDFQLMYQDIVPTPQGSISGRHLEVLICLPDASGRFISPGEFLPAARRYGLMGRIDRWVTAQVGEWLHWRAGSGRSLPELVTINLSGSSFSDPEFRDFAEEQARVLPAAASFCFEITEGEAIANLAEASSFISRMKNHGCRFALDDFGSGLSSFAYLKRLPVDFVKIDGQFVQDVATDPVNFAMVEAIHKIGKIMGLQSIAAQVETQAAFECIRSIGVDYCQGYYFGGLKPLLSLA